MFLVFNWNFTYLFWSALLCAFKAGHVDIIKLLLAQEGIEYDTQNDFNL